MLNNIKTFLLLTVLTLALLLLGNMFGGRQGMIIALAVAFAMNFTSYWYSDKIILSVYKARAAERSTNPGLYSAVEELSQAAGMPMPGVYIIPSQAPNAFATGRSPQHAAVAVTEGLLRLLNNQELRGVIAHELSHVKNRDILIQTVAATVAGAIMFLSLIARWSALLSGRGRRGSGNLIALIIAAIIMPIAASLIQMFISRSREYQADSGGAQLSGNPQHLADALRKINAYGREIKSSQATAHMFIAKPFKARGLQSLFSTHPPVEKRIRRLLNNSRN
ncbi:MAG: zinc metalloprotease HtpX [Elusimicrobiota bacterium]